jgi:hypothetical protein
MLCLRETTTKYKIITKNIGKDGENRQQHNANEELLTAMPSFSSFRRSRNIGSARSRGPLSSEPELPLWSSIAEPVYASSISARSICTENDNSINRLELDIALIVFLVK